MAELTLKLSVMLEVSSFWRQSKPSPTRGTRDGARGGGAEEVGWDWLTELGALDPWKVTGGIQVFWFEKDSESLFHPIFLFCTLAPEFGIIPGAWHMLDKGCTTELHPQLLAFFFF